jgi:hypothetical protein
MDRFFHTRVGAWRRLGLFFVIYEYTSGGVTKIVGGPLRLALLVKAL